MCKCFVLMAYGTSDTEREESSVRYEEFFLPICEKLGYSRDQIERADTSGEDAGSIAKTYLTRIAGAEVVMADLNYNRPSVYYEIGVRHALVKKTTLILAPRFETDGSEFKVAFDVANDHHLFKYNPSLNIVEVRAEVARMASEIRKWLDRRLKNDSPVFTAVPDMTAYQERIDPTDERKKIDQLTAQLAQKSEEITALQSQLAENAQVAHSSYSSSSYSFSETIDFDEAEDEQKLYGSEILKELIAIRQSIEEGDAEKLDEFKSHLRYINKSDYIDARTFRLVAQMCDDLSLPSYQMRVLEAALARYPNDDDIRFELIDLYHESQSPKMRRRAVEMCEVYFKIETTEDGVAEFNTTRQVGSIQTGYLISLFNSYIATDEYAKLESVTDSFQKHFGQAANQRCLALIPRNKAVAKMERGHSKEAVALFKQAYEQDRDERTVSLLSKTCYEAGRKEVGYLLKEFLVIQEPEEAEYYISLVNNIRRFGFLRTGTSDPEFTEVGITFRPFEKYVIPILYRAMTVEHCEDEDKARIRQLLTDFKSRQAKDALNFFNENDLNQFISKKLEENKDSLQKGLDSTIVDYLDQMISECNNPEAAQKLINDIFDRLESAREESSDE